MQLSQSDLEALDDRLRNWGRWAADRPAIGSSYLWRAMKKYGKDDEAEGDDEQDAKPPKIDVLDALLVERAWVSLAESPFMYHQAKWVLRAHYCLPQQSIAKTAKKLKFRERHYDKILNLGRKQIENVLIRFEKILEAQHNVYKI
nr:MAG TPA: DNA-directed RNA polymerase subunit alpha [Caudoviricetes sp.]